VAVQSMRTLFHKLLSLKSEVADHVKANGRGRGDSTQLGDRAVKLSKTAHAMARRVTDMHPTAPIYPTEILVKGAPLHALLEETVQRYAGIWNTGPRSSGEGAPAKLQIFAKEKFIVLLPTALTTDVLSTAIATAKQIAAAGRELAGNQSFGQLANGNEIKVDLGNPVHVFALLLQTCELGVGALQARYPPLARQHVSALVIPDFSIKIKVQEILRAMVDSKKVAQFSQQQVTALSKVSMVRALKRMSPTVSQDVINSKDLGQLMKLVVVAAEKLSIVPAIANSEDDEGESSDEEDNSS
jgi:hypothetical protein